MSCGDNSSWRSRPTAPDRWTRRLRADLVLALDRETEREARALKLRAPVEMLGDHVGTGEEVEDPYGRSPAMIVTWRIS